MATFFSTFKNQYVPVIEWNFFPSLKEGRKLFNEETWSGWDKGWVPIATNVQGDAIIIKDDCIYELMHDTGGPPKPALITKDIAGLERLLKELKKYHGIDDHDSAEILKKKKQRLTELRKSAPRLLKSDFTEKINDLAEEIKDFDPHKRKEREFMDAVRGYINLVLPDLKKDGRFIGVSIFRHSGKHLIVVGGELKDDESVDEVKRVFAKYPPPYPLEFVEFKPWTDEDA